MEGVFSGNVTFEPGCQNFWHVHHGAVKDGWFAHLSMEIPAENKSNEWLEPVSDEEYDALDWAPAAAATPEDS